MHCTQNLKPTSLKRVYFGTWADLISLSFKL